ncbi:MAG: DUF3649 domain-containing protein [Nitrosomonas sp.]|nr:DUF3649 domain-containing protein [Nitrosomonas sp.]MDL1863659.1 DUF3649 domain-containing protein [Betaproteobacteria bacterium PRO5]
MKDELPRTYRGAGIASRIAAAVFGGYALSNLLAIALVPMLSASTADGTLAGMQWTFLFYTGTVLWVFAACSAWRAWAGLLLPAGLLVLLLAVQGFWP